MTKELSRLYSTQKTISVHSVRSCTCNRDDLPVTSTSSSRALKLGIVVIVGTSRSGRRHRVGEISLDGKLGVEQRLDWYHHHAISPGGQVRESISRGSATEGLCERRVCPQTTAQIQPDRECWGRHIAAFARALQEDEGYFEDAIQAKSPDGTSTPRSTQSVRIRKVSALSDFAPVNLRVRRYVLGVSFNRPFPISLYS